MPANTITLGQIAHRALSDTSAAPCDWTTLTTEQHLRWEHVATEVQAEAMRRERAITLYQAQRMLLDAQRARAWMMTAPFAAKLSALPPLESVVEALTAIVSDLQKDAA
jgi:hypothetical protein